MDISRYDAVQVDWIDSTGDAGAWTHIDEHSEVKVAEVSTVGFLLKEDDKSVTVALSLDLTNDHYSSLIVIPKAVITSIALLIAAGEYKDVKSKGL